MRSRFDHWLLLSIVLSHCLPHRPWPACISACRSLILLWSISGRVLRSGTAHPSPRRRHRKTTTTKSKKRPPRQAPWTHRRFDSYMVTFTCLLNITSSQSAAEDDEYEDVEESDLQDPPPYEFRISTVKLLVELSRRQVSLRICYGDLIYCLIALSSERCRRGQRGHKPARHRDRDP